MRCIRESNYAFTVISTFANRKERLQRIAKCDNFTFFTLWSIEFEFEYRYREGYNSIPPQVKVRRNVVDVVGISFSFFFSFYINLKASFQKLPHF